MPISLAHHCQQISGIRQIQTHSQRRSLHTSFANAFHGSRTLRALRPSGSSVEQGLTFRGKPLSSTELRTVYGDNILSPQLGNRLLRVLHGRRVDGTLDLPLPNDLQSQLRRYPYAVESALYWLRSNYEVDEDAAILARIEREDAGTDTESPSVLAQRGQKLGLYGPQSGRYDSRIQDDIESQSISNDYQGPQSGHYQAPLSEKGDVFGQSKLEKIRAENEAKAAREEEELEQQISQITAREEKKRSENTALANRPEQGIEAAEEGIRAPNEFEKWVLRTKNRATSKLTLDSPELQQRSIISRLLPSLLFCGAFGLGLYAFIQSWKPPSRSERLWPDMSLSFATVCGLTAVNVGVFILWKVPSAWSILNRYFILVPVTIKPLSLVGSVFSHTGRNHLIANTVGLLVFGPSLHEDLGRAEFLACFLLGGLVGNYCSLVYNVLGRMWTTTSLGASGGIWAIMSAYCCLHSHDKFTAIFLPEKWKETLWVHGWVFLLGIAAVDVLNFAFRRVQSVNYMAHFGGAITGWVYAEAWKNRRAASQNTANLALTPTRPWWDFILPTSAGQKKP